MTPSTIDDASSGVRSGIASWLLEYMLYPFLILALAVRGLFSPTFLSGNNLYNLILQWAPMGIVVIGQTFVIIVRGLDLSVASVMATAAVIATSFRGLDADIPQILTISICIALVVGLINGVLVTKRNVSPFLATLATMILLQGFRFADTQGAPSGHVPPLFRFLGSEKWRGVPYNAFIGRRVYMVGGNPITARLVGINADLVTISCYAISSCLAAVAGLVISGYVGIVDNWVGQGYELDSIVAAVIGGVAAVIVVIGNEVLMFGLPIQFQIIVKGVVLVFAAALYANRSN